MNPAQPAARPRVGFDTVIALDNAVAALGDSRYLRPGDTAAQLHLLASLIAQAETTLAQEIETAQAQGATWAQIGQLIGMTATAARQQYSYHPKNAPKPRPKAIR